MRKLLLGVLLCALAVMFISCGTPAAVITLDESKVDIAVGETHEFKFTVENGVGTATYEVADTSIISIENAVVKGLKEGTTTVHMVVVADDKANTTREANITVQVTEKRTVAISFKSDVAGFTKASETVKYGTTYTLPQEGPAIDGYKFLGWSLNGTDYVTELANLQADQEVKAVYEALKYTLTKDVNGETSSETVAWGTVVALSAISVPGYDFLGWALEKDGTTYVTEVEVKADATVYACLAVKKATITFELAEGKCDQCASLTAAVIGSTIDLSKLEPVKEGYNFVGWSTTEDGTSFVTEYVVEGDAKIYAIYQAILLTVEYELNGGAVYSSVNAVQYGTKLTLPSPTKVGSKFLGWTTTEDGTSYITEIDNVKANVKVYAHWEEEAFKIIYNLNNGTNYSGAPATIKASEEVTLGTPTRDGYSFLGWSTTEYANKFVTVLKNISADVVLYAKWTEGIVATPNTIESVIAGLAGGEKVVLVAGDYPGITINKPCTILGPNAYVDPNNEDRADEASFASVINVTANNVVINGIRLTADANITITNAQDVSVEYVLCQDTLMGSGNISTKAPVIAGNVKNLAVNFCRWEKSSAGSQNRNMILYGHGIENLTMTYNYFAGNKANYNDGIKIENSANGANISGVPFTYGVKGDVEISHNTFVDFQQYVIWIRDYREGNYVIEDNTFKNIGENDSHACLSFIAYTGESGGAVNVSMSYNTVESSKYLLRIDAMPTTAKVDVNNNIYKANAGTNAIHNKVSGLTVNASGNYFDSAVAFIGVSESNRVDSADAVATWASANAKEYNISYDLNGGKWTAKKMSMDEVIVDLLADLTVYYNKEATVANIHEISETAPVTMYGFFDTNKTKWGWLKDYLIDCRGKDANRSSGKSYLTDNNNSYWRYEVKGFVTKSAWGSWPYSADYSSLDFRDAFDAVAPMGEAKPGASKYSSGVATKLEEPTIEGKSFGGWMNEVGQIFKTIPASMEGDLNLKATWEETVYPNLVQISNFPTAGLKLYESLQLEWVVSPSSASNQNVTFASTDEKVFTVDKRGVITAKSLGDAKLRVKLEANEKYELLVDVHVYKGDYFTASYETNSFVTVGNSINLIAFYNDAMGQAQKVTWSSVTPDIATVEAGKVTAVKEGLATIRATYNDKTFDFVVTVLPEELSEQLQFIVDNHISNAKTTYNLLIGSGGGEGSYYYDVIGSVNNLLFDDFTIDRTYYDKLNVAGDAGKNNGLMNTVEFVTVHYTGNMAYTSDADNNADYFNEPSYAASIHYVTGRTNLEKYVGSSKKYNEDEYYAFAVLSEKYKGWHASDSSQGEHKWLPTGVMWQDGDPVYPEWSVSKNGKFTINGKETTVQIPAHPDGATVTGPTFKLNGTEYKTINDMGLSYKIVNGEYYMGNTYWGTQRAGKCICNIGGNHNSIGIESCVDKGSDLMHTWHVTAQLVADILVRNNLDITRVVGHHFFSGKDCPQPLLEDDGDLWWDFIKMVKAEYERITTYKDAEVTAKAVKADGVLRNNGLLVQDDQAHCVTYEVSVVINGVTQKITLATCVESYYECNCKRTKDSLQIEGFEII